MSAPVLPLSLPPSTRVVLVGNGPSLLAAQHGSQIDTFEEVIRFNRFKLNGFEPYTGTRTTLWSTFGHGYLPGDEGNRPNRIIFVYGERGDPSYEPQEIYRIPRAYYNDQRHRIRSAGKHPDVGMSSGFIVAMYCLEHVGLDQITLAGFDHFRKDRSNQHHYYNPKAYGRPPELDGDAEAALLAPLVEQGRIQYLN